MAKSRFKSAASKAKIMAIRRTIPRSQAIYPYGPGAILDWGQECFIVLDTKREGWRQAPKVFLPRLQNRLGAPEGFKLPPVAREGRPARPLDVQRFPAWLFCPRCRQMSKWDRPREVENRGEVPRCSNRGCGPKSILVPMRYVAVCEGGHIADVDWHRWTHSTQPGAAGPCDPRQARLYFDARADKGATLDALSIRCAICSAKRTLKEILNLNALAGIQKCRGRQPWQPRDEETGCDHRPRVLQRSQTAVHYADIVSALDLTAADNKGASEMDTAMQSIIDAMLIASQEEAEPYIANFMKKASSATGRTVDQAEVRSWLRQHFGAPEESGALGYSEAELLLEEWPALTTPSDSESHDARLVVRRDSADVALDIPGIRNVYLIERLREVRALRGFRRVRPDAEMLRPDLGSSPPQAWLPATEVFGEGIFLEFDVTALAKWEFAHEDALERRLARIRGRLVAGEGASKRFAHLAPVTARFMMLHTFSHLLMRQLCYECGYGGAAVRERLYVFEDRAGVLIYTADGDSEGSLGGLVRQGRNDRLGRTIASALERAAWCSNDPICREVPEHGFEKLDLAACHACALVAETSCTHLNALLDRQLVIGDGHLTVTGFFSDYLRSVSSV